MFLDTLNEPNFHPPVRNSTVQYDNIYVILWLRFSNYNQTKALNQTLPKIYIRWSKWNGKRRYDRKHKKTLNSLNCTSVFLDTSTIQKNTSIIHGLPFIRYFLFISFLIFFGTNHGTGTVQLNPIAQLQLCNFGLFFQNCTIATPLASAYK